jgi:hypothetical protein
LTKFYLPHIRTLNYEDTLPHRTRRLIQKRPTSTSMSNKCVHLYFYGILPCIQYWPFLLRGNTSKVSVEQNNNMLERYDSHLKWGAPTTIVHYLKVLSLKLKVTCNLSNMRTSTKPFFIFFRICTYMIRSYSVT